MGLASKDLAWLNATFAIVAWSYHLHRNSPQTLSLDCLLFRGQSLHLINEAIRGSSTDISDAIIGTVATLCNLDILNGNVPTARVHMAGLLKMVALRGGIERLGKMPNFLVKLVSW